MKRSHQLLRAGMVVLALAAALPAMSATSAPLPSAAAFFENPLFSGAVISPSGKYVAARLAKPGGRYQLAVIDLASRKAQVVANFSDADIGKVQWVNDQRLLFDLQDSQQGVGNVFFRPGMYAVDRDGGRLRQLVSRIPNEYYGGAANGKMLPWHITMMSQDGPQDSDWVYVEDRTWDSGRTLQYIDLVRLNTVDSRTEVVPRPGKVKQWMLDNAGQPRLAITFEGGMVSLLLLQGAEWRKIAAFSGHANGEDAMDPLRFGAGNTLYVSSRRGSDKSAVYRYDMDSAKLDAEPMLALDGYDFRGTLLVRDGQLLGVQYLRDGEGTQWFDPALQALQNDIDQQLPNMVNMVQLPRDPQAPYLLVRSYSDVQPAVFYAYERAARKLSRVGETYPAIRPAHMGVQEQVRYTARDGLEIPAMLTLPMQSTGKHLPLVVLVHGGPNVRGTQWGWKPEVQFLASRGYAVLEPEYRGSTGYGERHYKAGWKQWGLKMQDDIADGVQWAVSKGYADAQRVCIAGASYGGYATLMGLINDPQLYRCGIDWVGVTDINLLYSGDWRYFDDILEDWKRYSMPDMIGDPVRDAAQLKATSPIEQAARIKRPLLLAYGGVDRRVPLLHGLRLRDAVRAANGEVEWIEYRDEGHGWSLAANRIDFWNRVEHFLDQHIGAAAPAK